MRVLFGDCLVPGKLPGCCWGNGELLIRLGEYLWGNSWVITGVLLGNLDEYPCESMDGGPLRMLLEKTRKSTFAATPPHLYKMPIIRQKSQKQRKVSVF